MKININNQRLQRKVHWCDREDRRNTEDQVLHPQRHTTTWIRMEGQLIYNIPRQIIIPNEYSTMTWGRSIDDAGKMG